MKTRTATKTRTTLQIMATILWFVFVAACSSEDINKVDLSDGPTITGSDPANLAGDMGTKISISATFNQEMNPSTINTSTFLLTQDGVPVQGTVVYKDRKATFTPVTSLASLSNYSAVIKSGVKNSAGKSLEKDYAWSFATCHPPEVIATSPTSDADCVELDQVIVAFFNHDVDPATVNATTFLLMTGTTSVAGVVTYSSSNTSAIFTPNADLLPGNTYTATLTTGIFHSPTIHMEKDYIWSFVAAGPNCEISQECPLNIDLKTAEGYGILAGVGITSVGLSEIHDMNVGISPGFRSSVTGFPPAVIFNGNLFAADDLAPPGTQVTQAQLDLTTAYLTAKAASSPTPIVISADLGGRTLGPGIYSSTSSMLLQSGDLILDGSQSNCDTSPVWIFQVGSALTTVGGSGGNIILIGGAEAKNVYWQVGSSATIGDGTSFKGNILSLTSITLGSGSTLEGRALARNGAVTLSGANKISKP